MSAFAFIKKKLLSTIDSLDSDRAKFVNSEKAFTRNRKIRFKDVLLFLLSLEQNSLNKELLEFYSYSPSSPSSSAMLQQRAKISPSVFPVLLHQFTSSCQKSWTYLGYLLLAVDGSDFSFPENPSEPDCHFKKKKERKGYSQIHVNAIYNLMDKVYEAVCIQPGKKKNEHQALIEMIHSIKRTGKILLFADRGYESYNTFAHILEKKWDFLIRGRQGRSTILSGLSIPEEEEEFDKTITLTLSNRDKRKGEEFPGKWKRLWATVKFDFFKEDKTPYTLTFRVVRIKISETVTEVLYTSLPKEKVSAEQLRDLYALRWGIETSFRKLKYTIGASAVHSKKKMYVMQEIYVKLILYNCFELMAGDAEKTKAKGKENKRINFSMASYICAQYLKNNRNLTGRKAKYLVQQYQEPVRKGHVYKRDLIPKRAISFQHRLL